MNQSPNHNLDEHSGTRTQTTESFIESQATHSLMHGRGQLLTEEKQRSLITYNHITYLLYVVSYFTAGLLWVVPIIMNYGKRRDADGTWLATHFDWQIKTFWYSIVFFVIGTIIITFALGGFGVSMLADSGNIAIGSFLLAGFGVLLMTFTFIWHLYRIVRGWIALTDKRPVP
ncbi:hypothetical protein [Psychrobacter sp. P11G5]|uniref:DUF4870 family protein n=1 Tax=unclassified Psychrobacter TaxID=196806 RepID=UPI000B17873F|nr:hypothetical protein [Psychrobacter sp. P11G5]